MYMWGLSGNYGNYKKTTTKGYTRNNIPELNNLFTGLNNRLS